jgi:hypothetical protein
MIFVVCGGRHFTDEPALAAALDYLHAEDRCILVITGGADGADRYADRWAMMRGIDRLIVPANWERDGKLGGPIRNTRLLQLARLLAEAAQHDYCLIAFPGEKGTVDMCRKARASGVSILYPLGLNASMIQRLGLA